MGLWCLCTLITLILIGKSDCAWADAIGRNSLRLVHTLWRHGDRTPAFKTFPTDTGNPAWSWPQGFGELSQAGMRQQYKLGAYLRSRYIDTGFLSADYNASEMYVRSTDFNRTLSSALSNLAGMYPPMQGKKWLESMTWQPIPVHGKPKMDDPLLWPDRPCPTYKDVKEKEIRKMDAVKKVELKNRDFLDWLSNQTGLKLESWVYDDIKMVYDPLFCEMMHNHTWPSWVTPQIFDKISSLFHSSTKFIYHTERIQRLMGGILFGEISTRFENKAKNSDQIPSALKYYAYSAHDLTLIAQLEILGAYDGEMPPYASAMLYELHEKQPGKFTIEIYYTKDQGSTPPVKVKIRGCNDPCELNTFMNIAKNKSISESDWYAECGLSNRDPNP